MCDFVKIKKTKKHDFVEFQLNMSTAAGRGEQTTKATLNCVFLSLSEGKVEKGNEKVTQNTADTTTTLKEFDFDPQRHQSTFREKCYVF